MLKYFHVSLVFQFLLFSQIFVVLSVTQCLHTVQLTVIPPYKKFDAYMRACKASGALAMIKQYDQLAEMMHKLRELDFGVVESWNPNEGISYKGCEPMKRSRHSVHCDWSIIFVCVTVSSPKLKKIHSKVFWVRIHKQHCRLIEQLNRAEMLHIEVLITKFLRSRSKNIKLRWKSKD